MVMQKVKKIISVFTNYPSILVARREFMYFFNSPLIYGITGIFAFLWSLRFAMSLVRFSSQSKMFAYTGRAANANLHNMVFVEHISLVNLILIFVVPAITMKLISEDKKTKTFDLLLTAPIHSGQIVVGKFIAGVCAIAFFMMISILYPVMASFFSTIDWSLLIVSYFGIFLLGILYVSVGMFCSSLTDSMMVSLICGVVLNISLLFIGSFSQSSFISSDFAIKFFEHISVFNHVEAFIKGNMQIASLVFFISLSGFFIFLTERVVESHRWR